MAKLQQHSQRVPSTFDQQCQPFACEERSPLNTRGSSAPAVERHAGGGSWGEVAAEYVARLVAIKVVVACVNSPESVTISDDITAIQELV